jgi:hypothetical protein
LLPVRRNNCANTGVPVLVTESAPPPLTASNNTGALPNGNPFVPVTAITNGCARKVFVKPHWLLPLTIASDGSTPL